MDREQTVRAGGSENTIVKTEIRIKDSLLGLGKRNKRRYWGRTVSTSWRVPVFTGRSRPKGLLFCEVKGQFDMKIKVK